MWKKAYWKRRLKRGYSDYGVLHFVNTPYVGWYLEIVSDPVYAPYGGQAKSEARFIQRQSEHARAYPDADFDFTIVKRANPGVQLDIAEHNFIQELTGGVAARKSPLVSNLKDPIGPARRSELGLPEPQRSH